jgi:hypothetical protein
MPDLFDESAPRPTRPTPSPGSGKRGWVKVKNPTYWRRELEIEAVQSPCAGRSTAFV